MNRKRFPLFVLIGGLILTAFSLVLPIIIIRCGGTATGIVGGADFPTYWFVLSKCLGGSLLCLSLLGAAMALTSLPVVIFPKTFQRICTQKTSGLAIALSAIGGLGLMCAIICFLLASLDFSRSDPYYFILYIVGLFAFIGFIALICLYFEARGKKPSIMGLIYDVICSILYLPAFFYTFNLVAALF